MRKIGLGNGGSPGSAPQCRVAFKFSSPSDGRPEPEFLKNRLAANGDPPKRGVHPIARHGQDCETAGYREFLWQ